MGDDGIPEYRIAPSNGLVGVASDPELFRVQIRRYLRHRRDEGAQFVKTAEVAEALDAPTTRTGVNLSWLADDGAVESWGGDASGTWRITLEETNE